MALYDVPMVFVLIGLIAYTVLSGADFGAGLWQLTAGKGPKAAALQEHAHHAIAPVWEANHVWLVFVLTVLWTTYPVAFGSIASTLTIPLFIAAVGIICRGATYALDAGAANDRERRAIDAVFSASCALTPFAMGTAVGGIASGRVPVGNAAGDLFTSWLNPTSVLVGILAVVLSAFLAAVYLGADAQRIEESDLVHRFRWRALASGVVAGIAAVAGLPILHADAPSLLDGLLRGGGLVALIVSCVCGLASLVLVWVHRFAPARYTAAVAAAAIIVGWAVAQYPVLLPGLTVEDAAAPDSTLIAVTISVLAGAVLLLPSLALLFRLDLRGRFDVTPQHPDRSSVQQPPARPETPSGSWFSLSTRVAIACLLLGVGLLNVADAAWAHAVGVVALFGFVVSGLAAVKPEVIAAESDSGEVQHH
ncbi:cytochrome d ubiquinol oxidase subunit II [Skermania sp. ID1734]|uniref:cytochrome d ubiquinol oxidase subunit II n=1 Tax=Skermania sp. ID1734 TaxID=2597516 RepID=UPI00117E182C|nr:cytochrome d ubiquinol oxidase subunit II [Skermania sp. ID1734]TSD99935.1 cytochrome d ubiquinol oxidase subunit II [Skermania sp. ID1734]